MGEPKKNIYIHGPRPGELIEITPEEFKVFTECVSSKFKTIVPVSLMASSVIALSAPIKKSSNIFFKRLGIGVCCYFISSIFGNVYAANACSPVLKRVHESLNANSYKQMPDTENPPSDSSESFDFTPMAFTSDPDMNPPSSFSLDPGFKLYNMDEEKEITRIPESKPLTYEELRNRSRGQYWSSPYSTTSNPEENKPEVKEDDNWNSGSNTWPRRTNIYGDVLE